LLKGIKHFRLLFEHLSHQKSWQDADKILYNERHGKGPNEATGTVLGAGLSFMFTQCMALSLFLTYLQLQTTKILTRDNNGEQHN
jgi:hypothetical protein